MILHLTLSDGRPARVRAGEIAAYFPSEDFAFTVLRLGGALPQMHIKETVEEIDDAMRADRKEEYAPPVFSASTETAARCVEALHSRFRFRPFATANVAQAAAIDGALKSHLCSLGWTQPVTEDEEGGIALILRRLRNQVLGGFVLRRQRLRDGALWFIQPVGETD